MIFILHHFFHFDRNRPEFSLNKYFYLQNSVLENNSINHIFSNDFMHILIEPLNILEEHSQFCGKIIRIKFSRFVQYLLAMTDLNRQPHDSINIGGNKGMRLKRKTDDR